MTMIFVPGSPPPLLSYGLEADPDPVVADAPFVLKLVVSNAGDDPVTCTSISLTFPVGTDATDLIDGSTTMEVRPASGWTSHVDGGAVTLTPPGGSVEIKGEGLVFTISNAANAKPGTAAVTIGETASDDGGTQQQGTGSFAVDKFPADFSLSDLTPIPPDKLDYAYGESACLTWVATGAGVSCSLDYQPAPSGDPVSVPVPELPAGGSYRTEKLTRSGSVTFTLTAQVRVLGQDNPLVANRQLTVTVEQMSLTVTALPPRVGVNGLVLLQWNAPNADHCLFEDGTVLATSGSRYVVLAQTHIFTVTAVAAAGQRAEAQQTVTVDPAIVPTEAGFSQIGDRGEDGVPGYYITGRYQVCGNGGNGGNASLTVSLPPLDTSGVAARAIPITVAGGAGGTGGVMAAGWPMPSGNGGKGGDASLSATFDSTQSPPAQFIITVTGGAAGAGGSTTPQGANGTPGSILSAKIDGHPVYFA